VFKYALLVMAGLRPGHPGAIKGLDLADKINADRTTPLVLFEKVGLTKRVPRAGCAGVSDDVRRAERLLFDRSA
jgi:hypothetical protein